MRSCCIHLRVISQEMFNLSALKNYLFKITATSPRNLWVNTRRPGQNGCHFADDIFIFLSLNEKFYILIKYFIEVCSWGSNWKWVIIGLGNGLAPNRQLPITQTNGDHALWCHMSSLGNNEFKCWIVLRNINTYLHFLSCLSTEMAQVAEILPNGWQAYVAYV